MLTLKRISDETKLSYRVLVKLIRYGKCYRQGDADILSRFLTEYYREKITVDDILSGPYGTNKTYMKFLRNFY